MSRLHFRGEGVHGYTLRGLHNYLWALCMTSGLRSLRRNKKCGFVLFVVISLFSYFLTTPGASYLPSAVPVACNLPCLTEWYNQSLEQHAKDLLVLGSKAHAKQRVSVFEAVDVSLQLPPALFVQNPLPGRNGVKHVLRLSGQNCIVYGVGIDGDSSFEWRMASFGNNVFAFDCTVSPYTKHMWFRTFYFRPWCIGRKDNVSFQDNSYVKNGNSDSLIFRELPDVMASFKHHHIHVLKMDIEGFEWELLERQLFSRGVRPWQIAVELHTETAKPQYVPPHTVQGKNYVAVNTLFLKLHESGYRVVYKELTDTGCAEFVLVRVDLAS